MSRPLVHGTVGGYTNHKCRCALCQEAQREYQRGYLALKKLKGLCRRCTATAEAGKRFCQRHLDAHAASRNGYRRYVVSDRKQKGNAA